MPTLEFKGKQHVYAHHLTVPHRPLVPDTERSLHPAGADDNLIIHGDNLHALKALLPRHAGKVKCIYIDPPYNTGNEGWVYNDNVNSPLMCQWLAANSPVDGEDLERHDKWLCMMWPRLHLLRELLADDGVIFVSIDDNEQHHLRMLMDEIFGEGNFVACLTWVKKQKTSGVPPKNKSIPNKEYILVYKKQQDFSFNGVPGSKESYQPDGQGNYYRTMPIQATGNQNNCFSIVNPQNGNSHCGNWAFSKERIETMIKENLIIFPKKSTQKPTQLVYYDEHKKSPILHDLGHYLGHYDSEAQTKKFKKEHPHINFDFPKPVSLLEFILRQSTTASTIVLDSFAGSGTTAQAVLALNKEDGGNRKFILVECEDYADTITAERVRRVINGVPGARDQALQEGLGGSFTYCTLGNPIEVEGMLTGESLPAYSQLAAYLLHTASGLSASGELAAQNEDGLFYRNGDTDYYLLYQPEIDWLRSNKAVLNEQQARRIHAIGRKARVFAADKYMSQRFLTDMGITFCQTLRTASQRVRGRVMELKDYQIRALDTFTRWRNALAAAQVRSKTAIAALAQAGVGAADIPSYPKSAWQNLAQAGEVANPARPYVERTAAAGFPIPHLCFKVPTGGGKTLLGAAALERLHRSSGLVLWMVPSNAIYQQTREKLWDRQHPYRQMLERGSGGCVKMLEKDDLFTAADVEHYLCVMLISLQSANRRNNRDFLRMFRDSGRYTSFFPASDDQSANQRLRNEFTDLDPPAADQPAKQSLFNVFKMKRPLVILDEAHKAYGSQGNESDEFVQSINRLNPGLVIELSATPGCSKSNLLVDVPGHDLKAEEMIKLPVQVTCFTNADWHHTLSQAHAKLEELDHEAVSLHNNKGRYIRPMVVVRVERTGRAGWGSHPCRGRTGPPGAESGGCQRGGEGAIQQQP